MFSAAFAADDIDFVLRHYVYPLASLLSRIEQVRSIFKIILRVSQRCGSRSRRIYPAIYDSLWRRKKALDFSRAKMERVRRVELPTLCLASIRSSQLSYTRVGFLLQQGRRFVNYSRLQCDSNARISNGKIAGGSWRRTRLRQPPKR